MSSYPVKSPKKLIEVALPLDEINAAAGREKSLRRGHPGTLAIWWAPRPLAATRAVVFSQLVNDPSWRWEMEHQGEVPPGHLKASWAASRRRLFKMLSDLVVWENTNNEELFRRAEAEIRRSWREVCELNSDHPDAERLFNSEKLPGLHDPFAGGGAIPLEAQRLGLEAYASDLNPVAVLINKAKLEIPPRFRSRAPIHPAVGREPDLLERAWKGAEGLAEDVRRYGATIAGAAKTRLGHLYPKVRVSEAVVADRPDLTPYVGQELTVIAWLWARTVRSENPAFSHLHVPLVSSFVLSRKPDNEAWIKPVIEGEHYRFAVMHGEPPAHAAAGTKATGSGAKFRCLLSGTPISAAHIRSEAQSDRLGARLTAIVAEGKRGRVFLSPTAEAETAARASAPSWSPDVEFLPKALGFRVGKYGMAKWSDLFTPRQLVALNTYSDLIIDLRTQVESDAISAGFSDDGRPLDEGGSGARAYSEAVAVYSAIALTKAADLSSALCRWQSNAQHLKIAPTFSRPVLSMCWDYAEGNPFSTSSGNYMRQWKLVAGAIEALPARGLAHASQDACQSQAVSHSKFVSTDPPYYDNIGYADLSDFFYVWLRRALRPMFPALFAGMVVPKAEELVATPARHGSAKEAERFFLVGMTDAFRNLRKQAHPGAPITIYYAFKQSETTTDKGTSSTGWETFLEAVIASGFRMTGTWPMRTERKGRPRGNSSNALASSVVLVCRPRAEDSPTTSRRQFIRELDLVLPEALDEMTRGSGSTRSPIAPVDLSQAIIGPGMAVFSKYTAVLEADGTPMTVKTALRLINRFLAEDDFDRDTQFCLHWFDQNGWNDGAYGEADVLSRAKATSVGGLEQAGVLTSGSGKVRLRRWSDYPADWDPSRDTRLPVWEALHQLIRALRTDGETGAGQLLCAVLNKSEAIRQLAYRLYTLCERRGWAEDARAYNELVTSWAAIEAVASAVPNPISQLSFFGEKP